MFQILKGYLTDLTLCYNLVFLCSHSPMYGCRIAAVVCRIHVVEHGFHFKYLLSCEWAVLVDFLL